MATKDGVDCGGIHVGERFKNYKMIISYAIQNSQGSFQLCPQ